MEPYIETITAIHRVHAVLYRIVDKKLKDEFGLSAAQFKILWVLSMQTKGLQQATIAFTLNYTEAAASRQLRGLSLEGWVKIKTDPSNRRSHIVALTPKGRKLAEDAKKIISELQQPYFKELKQEDIITCNRVLRTIFMNTADAEGQPSRRGRELTWPADLA